jgi:hypothetical protein
VVRDSLPGGGPFPKWPGITGTDSGGHAHPLVPQRQQAGLLVTLPWDRWDTVWHL